MLTITYALNFSLMIAMPLLLGWWLAKRHGLAWRLGIIFGLRSPDPEQPIPAIVTEPEPHLYPTPPAFPTDAAMDRSRYSE